MEACGEMTWVGAGTSGSPSTCEVKGLLTAALFSLFAPVKGIWRNVLSGCAMWTCVEKGGLMSNRRASEHILGYCTLGGELKP